MQRGWPGRGELTWRVAAAQAVKRLGQALAYDDAERTRFIPKLKPQMSLILLILLKNPLL
jgi:hypothetical protein